jgi:hypothetical protein
MEGLIKHIQRANMIGAIVGIVLVAIIVAAIWYRRRRSREGFQEQPASTAQEIAKEIPIPENVSNPTPTPMDDQAYCATVKKGIDALRLTEMNKKMKEFVESEGFKVMKSNFEEKFRTLNCKEYLEKIAAGVIPAPQTSPDMRPPPPAAVS